MGGYGGEPAKLERCGTVDLEVPASAEVVIEGFIRDDPTTYEIEGHFGEFTGYVGEHPIVTHAPSTAGLGRRATIRHPDDAARHA
jgi:UbiD family decarboxylase